MKPRIVFLLTFSIVILSAQSLFASKDTIGNYYADTSYTYKVLQKLVSKYNNVNGTLTYNMSMKQYDSSLTILIDSSKSSIRYSGAEVAMRQKDDLVLVHDSLMLYLNYSKKEMYLQIRKKGKSDMKFSGNPMSFLLDYYKERKLVIRKIAETEKTYTYSVDFDYQKDMYLVTADKKTDYILSLDINYFVPDNANLVSSRRLIVTYSNYNFNKQMSDKELFDIVRRDNTKNYIPTSNYQDYKINIYGN